LRRQADQDGILKRSALLLLSTILAAACQVFRSADVPATLQAQNAAYIAEATALAQTHDAAAAQVLTTAQVAETYVAREESINQVLVVTVRAGDPPTVGRNVGNAAGAAGTPEAGETAFVDIQMAASVRESDSCANSIQTQFPGDTQEIYATARALNIRAGTQLSVEWRYEGQVVWQESWTVPVDSDSFCLWFNLDPLVVALSPGNWSASLYADGVNIGSPIPFSILDTMTEAGS
jgi:hypothetical protein